MVEGNHDRDCNESKLVKGGRGRSHTVQYGTYSSEWTYWSDQRIDRSKGLRRVLRDVK